MAERGVKQKKKRNRRAKRVAAGVVTLLLAAAAVLVFIYRDKLTQESLYDLFREGTQVPETEEAEPYTYEAGTGQVFDTAGNGIAVVSTSGIQLLDGEGRTVCRHVFSIQTPAVAASARHAAFYDVGGTILRVADFDGEYTNLDTQDAIVSVTMNEDGWMAVTTEKTGYKGYVVVYDAELTPVYEWYSGTGYTLTAAVAPDNHSMAVLCAGAEGGRVVQFDLSKAEPRSEFLTPDELLIDLAYLSRDQLCALSENRAVFFDGKGQQLGEYSFGEAYLTDYAFGGDGFVSLLLSRYRSGNAMILANLDAEGAVLGQLELQRDMLSLSARGDQLLALFSDELTLYSKELEVQGSWAEVLGVKRAVLQREDNALLLSAYAAQPYQF